MKKFNSIFLSLICLAFSTILATSSVLAQAPNGFNYQAAIRNADGSVKNQENVKMEFSILQGSTSGTVLYRESQTLTTNDYGLVDHVIGEGTVISGNFSSINWSSGSKFLKVELEEGTSLTTISNSKLQSVPFAMFAAQAPSSGGSGQWSANGANISNNNSGNVGIGTNSPTEMLHMRNQNGNTVLRIENPTPVFESRIELVKNNLGTATLGYVQGDAHIRMQTDGNDIIFQPNQSEAMRMKPNGNIGIGSVNPSSPLTVYGSDKPIKFGETTNSSTHAFLTANSNYFGFQNSNGDNVLSVRQSSGNVGIGITNPSYPLTIRNASDGIDVAVNSSSAGDFVFIARSNFGVLTGLAVKANGNVGVNTTVPSTAFHVRHPSSSSQGLSISNAQDNDRWHLHCAGSNTLNLYYNNSFRGSFSSTSGAYSSASDERLKENIKPLENVLDKVLKLKVNRYNFKEDKSQESQIGLLAQESDLLFPEFIQKPEDSEQDVYRVNYAGFSMLAIKAIQEQEIKIEALEDRIAKLEALIKQSTAE
ncbi:MAG: tail fiber domain-containing protein [Vicingaceae bacterium]